MQQRERYFRMIFNVPRATSAKAARSPKSFVVRSATRRVRLWR
jgi:hypothetical protein